MDEFVGIVKIFCGTFAPQGWVFCNGALLEIAQYEVLYSLIGTTYGGDGVTTFGVPDLRSRIAVGGGQGAAPATQTIGLGELGGEEQHTLKMAEMPAHSHTVLVSAANSTQNTAVGNATMATPGSTASGSFVAINGYNNTAPDIALNSATVTAAGSSLPHNNMQPFLAVNYVICTDGLWPPRP